MTEVAPSPLEIDIVARQIRALFKQMEKQVACAFAPFNTLATLAMLASVASEPTKSLILNYLSKSNDENAVFTYYSNCYHVVSQSLRDDDKHDRHSSMLLLEKSFSWCDEAIQAMNELFDTKVVAFVEFNNESDNVLRSKCNDHGFTYPTIFRDRPLSILGQAFCKVRPKLILEPVEHSFVTTENGWKWYHCLTSAAYSRTEQVSIVNFKADGHRIVSFIKPAPGVNLKELCKRWGTHQLAEWISRRNEKKVNIKIPLCCIGAESEFFENAIDDNRIDELQNHDLVDFSRLCESNSVAFDGLQTYGRIILTSPTTDTDLQNPEKTPIPEMLKKGVPGYIDFKIDDSFIIMVATMPPAFALLVADTFDTMKGLSKEVGRN